MSQNHREKRNDFSGGFNSRDRSSMLRPNESPNMLNVIVEKRGTITTRPGTELYLSEPVSDPIEVGGANPPVTSIYEFVNRSGAEFFLAFAGESLKVAVSPGWVLLSDEFTENVLFEFITHPIADLALFVNGADGYWETGGTAVTTNAVEPHKTLYEGVVDTNNLAVTWVEGDNFELDWAGETIIINDVAYTVDAVADDENLTILASAGVQNDVDYSHTTDDGVDVGNSMLPWRPKFIEYHKYRVWLANVEGFPDRVYFNVDDVEGNTLYNYFTAWSWLRSANQKGERITGIKSFKGVLYVFTPTTIRAITGDDIDDFAMSDVSNTVGAVSQRSIQVLGNYLIFLGVDGVYMFDGQSTPFKISQRIDPTLNDVRRVYWPQASGIAYENKYMVSVPLAVGGAV
jgi:hypothetical protein